MSRPAKIKSVMERVDAVAWPQVAADLHSQGNGVIKAVLSSDECDEVRKLYDNDDMFRSRVVMERHGFGQGEYRYFSYPLPDLISDLRTSIYPHLVPVANKWNEAMGIRTSFPPTHAEYI